jgi:MSHA biogenesis protein MshQ
MSQPMLNASYTLEARNSLGGRVENYAAVLLGAGAVASVSIVAEDSDEGIDRGARLAGLASSWTLGRYAVATTAASFARAASADGPFNALEIGVRLTDAVDSVPLSGLDMNAGLAGDCAAATNCTAARLGTAQRLVYGRLAVSPAFGPETRDLPVPLEAQRFDGGAFVVESADNCTTYQSLGATLSGYSGNLEAGDTAVIAPGPATSFIGGQANPTAPLMLSAPGMGNDGAADVVFDAPAWLEFDWIGSGVTDPRATVRFGRYRGHDRVIYWREL